MFPIDRIPSFFLYGVEVPPPEVAVRLPSFQSEGFGTLTSGRPQARLCWDELTPEVSSIAKLLGTVRCNSVDKDPRGGKTPADLITSHTASGPVPHTAGRLLFLTAVKAFRSL